MDKFSLPSFLTKTDRQNFLGQITEGNSNGKPGHCHQEQMKRVTNSQICKNSWKCFFMWTREFQSVVSASGDKMQNIWCFLQIRLAPPRVAEILLLLISICLSHLQWFSIQVQSSERNVCTYPAFCWVIEILICMRNTGTNPPKNPRRDASRMCHFFYSDSKFYLLLLIILSSSLVSSYTGTNPEYYPEKSPASTLTSQVSYHGSLHEQTEPKGTVLYFNSCSYIYFHYYEIGF